MTGSMLKCMSATNSIAPRVRRFNDSAGIDL